MQRSRFGRVPAIAAALFVWLIGGALAPAQAADKIENLIQAMTLDEKIGMLTGWPFSGTPDPLGLAGAGYTPGVPRLGIPPLRYSDGPAGVRTATPATVLPAPVSLAATFSSDHARAYGNVIGVEMQARRQDVLFGPMVNLVRVPLAGRNFETLGEDPFLMSRLVEQETKAITREGIVVTIKHYAENNQENNRMQVNVNVADQTLREIELPAFEASINAGAGAVMCAYNKMNALPSCENPTLLADILRGDWRFSGFVVSDYGANHSAAPALKAGLDVEFLSPFFADPNAGLKALVLADELPVAVVDGAVRHILTTMNRFGWLKHAAPDGATVVERPRPEIDPNVGVRTAQEVALAGAVLLRNERKALPLGAADLRSLAVIGPTARSPLIGGGGSARVLPFPGAVHSTLELLQARAGAKITFETGTELDGVAAPPSALSPPDEPSVHGLRRTQTDGTTQIDAQVDFTGANAIPAAPVGTWTWTGTLTAPVTGDYELRVQSLGVTVGGVVGFNARLTVDGSIIGSTGGLFPANGSLFTTADGLANSGALVHLEGGVPHSLELVVNVSPTGPTQVRLAWITPQHRQAQLDAAVAAARSARAAVLFAYNEGTEGIDRMSLMLPKSQDALIAAVADANPNTVVVLNTGDPVTMPWADDVAAILQMWYPGQEGGEATVALLLGDANPSGKLPVTFPARLEDNPTFSPDGRRYPGIPPTGPGAEEFYDEGIFVGYRWYDRQGITPLFPFGHGLSYTQFKYSDLALRGARDHVDVSFVVRNVGDRRGAEVPQVYIGPARDVPAGVQMADRALVGFERIELDPGETKRVRIRIGTRQLSYWSAALSDWVIAAGRRAIAVGASSRDLRLHGEVRVER